MVPCSGWWQQNGYGRQPMNDLKIDFRGPTIYGEGKDVIAAFTMVGKFRQDGSVEILKQYQNRHSVLYVGIYDGEGNMRGKWDISGYQGEWSIRMSSGKSELSQTDIEEIG